MTVQSDEATSTEKEIKTGWPYESGGTAGTTKQEGRQIALVPDTSLIDAKDKVGIDE
jgi:hypothetical protein